MYALLPFFPEKDGLKVPSIHTPFPVVWTAKNIIEGNYAGMNRVLEKFPEAKTYVRFVVSTAKSFDIMNDPNTRAWSGSRRGNIFQKYPYPIETSDMQQSAIYKHTRLGQLSHFSMHPPPAPAPAPAEGFIVNPEDPSSEEL